MKKLAVVLFAVLMSTLAVAQDRIITYEMGGFVRIEYQGRVLRAQMFAMDMPKTFASGSCITAGGMLLLERPSMQWYCYEDNTIDKLES